MTRAQYDSIAAWYDAYVRSESVPDGSTSRENHGYFDQVYWRSKNAKGLRGKVGAYHRTLSTYINTTIRAGFTIEHVLELRVTGRVVDRIPGYAVVPGFLMVQCRKR